MDNLNKVLYDLNSMKRGMTRAKDISLKKKMCKDLSFQTVKLQHELMKYNFYLQKEEKNDPVIKKLIEPLKFFLFFKNFSTADTKQAIELFMSLAPLPIK